MLGEDASRVKRGGDLAAVLLLLGALTACGSQAGPAPSPPAVAAVGIATDVQIHADGTRLVFADGSVHEVPSSYRWIGEAPGLSWLVIIGSDGEGNFVASFPLQDGLPPDCYRENAVGIDRGAYIEAEGVLWAKAPDFSASAHPDTGSAYPAGTRFCFNERGLVSGTIGAEVGQLVYLDSWTFAADRRAITVNFVGGRELDLGDPCSKSYHGTAEVDGEELAIGIYTDPFPGEVPDDLACTAEGYARSLDLQLSRPFYGTRIHDLAGQLYFLEAPPGLVEITGLPDGWVERSAESLSGSPTGRWQRTYALPGTPVGAGRSAGQVVLIQAFDAPANVTGGDLEPDVTINGERATSYLWEPVGEMVLVWKVGDDGVALVGNLADFRHEEFVALAESIVPGSPGE